MSWYNPIDWYVALSTGTSNDTRQKEGDALDAEIARQNELLHATGIWDEQQWAQVQDHQRTGATGDVSAQTTEAFMQGASDALANEQSWFKRTLTSITGGVLGFIPWWLWVVAILAGLVWLEQQTGFLRRKLSKA